MSRCAAGRLLLATLVFGAACSNGPGTVPTPATPVATATATPTAPVEPSPSATPSPDPAPTPEPEPASLDAFDADRALTFATALAELGTRDAGTPGDIDAQDMIDEAFSAAGWSVARVPVALPQGGATANLVATVGEVDLDAPHLLIGGHFDTIGGSPGANDNASGIGVIIALAEELADEAADLPLPIVLVAFGAEEYQPAEPRVHHLGSEQYAKQYAQHVTAALVIDMVGNGADTCICWLDDGPRTLVDRLQAVAEHAELAGFRPEARGDISDHGPFALRGRPAAFLWTGRDGRLHTPADTAEHLRVDDLRRAGDLALAFVRDLGAEDVAGLRPVLGGASSH